MVNYQQFLTNILPAIGQLLSESEEYVWTVQIFVNEKCCTVETLYSTIYYSKYFIELNID